MIMYILFLLFLVFILIIFIIWYLSYYLQNTKLINGFDKHFLNLIDYSTLINVVHFDKDIEYLKNKFRLVYLENPYVLTRYIENKNGQYYLSNKKINNLDEFENYLTQIIEINNNVDRKTILSEKFIQSFPTFKLVIDNSNKLLYCISNHSFFDGKTLLDLMSKIFDYTPYNITIPKFKYMFLYSEYSIIRSCYNILMANKKTLQIPNNTTKVKDVIHIKIKSDDFKKFVPDILSYLLNIIINTNNYLTFNTNVLFALDNNAKINNASIIDFVFNKNDVSNILEKKINKLKYMIYGTYYLSNIIHFFGERKGSTPSENGPDIAFSSLPVSKTNSEMESLGVVIPFTGLPIYIFCQKYNKNTICSIHISDKTFDTNKLIQLFNNESRIQIISHDILNLT
jgi:hypothetical protein